jgi:hypothetical protein
MIKKITTLCSLLCFCGCVGAVDPALARSADTALMNRVTHLTTEMVCDIQNHDEDLKTLLETFDIDCVRNREDIFDDKKIIDLTIDQLEEFYDELNQMMCDVNECQFHIGRCGLAETTIKRNKTQALDALSHAIKTVKKFIDNHKKQSLSSTSDRTNTIINAISDIDVYCSEDENGIKTKRKKNTTVYLKKAKDLLVSDLKDVHCDIQKARKDLNDHGFLQKLIHDWKRDIKGLYSLLKDYDPLNTANLGNTEKAKTFEKYVDLTIALIHQRSEIFYKTLEAFYQSSRNVITALGEFNRALDDLSRALNLTE